MLSLLGDVIALHFLCGQGFPPTGWQREEARQSGGTPTWTWGLATLYSSLLFFGIITPHFM